jgi:predicted RecB family endonuclease
MIHTQTQIDNLIELAIIQRVELKKLVESLPELRTHLSVEIERNLNEIEPLLREELQSYLLTSSQAEHAKLGNALKQKIAELAVQLEDTTAAKYSVLMAERAENETLLAKAEARIAEAASALPNAVKEIVTDELSRFPRAGEIDQLRKEFAEPKGLNPRGKWAPGETYQRLDLVTWNGDSFVSNIDGNRERPSRSAAEVAAAAVSHRSPTSYRFQAAVRSWAAKVRTTCRRTWWPAVTSPSPRRRLRSRSRATRDRLNCRTEPKRRRRYFLSTTRTPDSIARRRTRSVSSAAVTTSCA